MLANHLFDRFEEESPREPIKLYGGGGGGGGVLPQPRKKPQQKKQKLN